MPSLIDPFASIPARGVASRFGMSAGARASIRPDDSVASAVERMAAQLYWADAMTLLAFAMPPHAAVEWAMQCVTLLHAESDAAQHAAIGSVHEWLQHESDTTRLHCFTAAKRAGYDTPAGCVALAAFWSGGGIGAGEWAGVEPAPELCHRAAACAVILAAETRTEHAASAYRQSMAMARKQRTAMHA